MLIVPSDLQLHYDNSIFGNVYCLALDNTKRKMLPLPYCCNGITWGISIFDIKVKLFYVPLPRFMRPIQLGSASWYVLIHSFKSKKKHKGLLYILTSMMRAILCILIISRALAFSGMAVTISIAIRISFACKH